MDSDARRYSICVDSFAGTICIVAGAAWRCPGSVCLDVHWSGAVLLIHDPDLSMAPSAKVHHVVLCQPAALCSYCLGTAGRAASTEIPRVRSGRGSDALAGNG